MLLCAWLTWLPLSAAGQAPLPPRHEPPGAGPQPAAVLVSWELEFRFLDPRRIEVQVPGRSEPETFWYVVYTVVNKSETTQRFHPMFQIVLEDLTKVSTDVGISPLVFEAIRERHRITHRDLVDPTHAIGDLRSGEDNARESVAIWRGVDLTGNSFSIFVQGLSGETRLVSNPNYDATLPETRKLVRDGREVEVTVNPKHFTLRKTLEIRYRRPGPQSAQSEPERESTRWIMS
jgi:hypothetical protein